MKIFKTILLTLYLGFSYTSFSQTIIGEASLDEGGAIFEYNILQNKFTLTAKLNPAIEGDVDSFKGSVCQCGDKFYGRTFMGGTNKKGTIYEYDPANKLSKVIYSFPTSETTEFTVTLCGNNKMLYGAGIDEINGAYIFELSPATKSFKSYPLKNVAYIPMATSAANGKLYFMYQKLVSENNMNYGLLEFDPNTKTVNDKISFPTPGGLSLRAYNRMNDVGNGKLAGTVTISGFGPTIFVYDYLSNSAKFWELQKEGKYGEAFGNLISLNGKVYMFNRGVSKKNTTIYSLDLNSSKFTEEYSFGSLPVFDTFPCVTIGTKIYGFSLRGTQLFSYDTKEKKAMIVTDVKGKVFSLGEFMVGN